MALQTVRETRPEVYKKVVASLLPRQVQAELIGPIHEDRVNERERAVQRQYSKALPKRLNTTICHRTIRQGGEAKESVS